MVGNMPCFIFTGLFEIQQGGQDGVWPTDVSSNSVAQGQSMENLHVVKLKAPCGFYS